MQGIQTIFSQAPQSTVCGENYQLKILLVQLQILYWLLEKTYFLQLVLSTKATFWLVIANCERYCEGHQNCLQAVQKDEKQEANHKLHLRLLGNMRELMQKATKNLCAHQRQRLGLNIQQQLYCRVIVCSLFCLMSVLPLFRLEYSCIFQYYCCYIYFLSVYCTQLDRQVVFSLDDKNFVKDCVKYTVGLYFL